MKKQDGRTLFAYNTSDEYCKPHLDKSKSDIRFMARLTETPFTGLKANKRVLYEESGMFDYEECIGTTEALLTRSSIGVSRDGVPFLQMEHISKIKWQYDFTGSDGTVSPHEMALRNRVLWINSMSL